MVHVFHQHIPAAYDGMMESPYITESNTSKHLAGCAIPPAQKKESVATCVPTFMLEVTVILHPRSFIAPWKVTYLQQKIIFQPSDFYILNFRCLVLQILHV